MNLTPELELLDRRLITVPGNDMPLHARVRRAMRKLIDEHFEDGQQFWTEQALVERLQVSQITVRRALSDLVSEGVLQRRPAKGSFVRKPATGDRGRPFSVGVFVPAYDSSLLAGMLDTLAQLCEAGSHPMNVYHTQRGRRIADAFDRLGRGSTAVAAGEERILLLGNSSRDSQELLAAVRERGYRMVALDNIALQTDCDYVGPDDAAGIAVALDHLFALGHRRIALLVSEQEDQETVIVRRRGYERRMAERGLKPLIVSAKTPPFGDPFDASLQIMASLWGGTQAARPTAILAVSDAGAWAALRWLAERGVSVPGEVSVMGFDDDRLSRFTHPALTTLHADRDAMVRRAMEILAGPPTRPAVHDLFPPTLVLRGSTGVAATPG